jgi:hypothetical protein
MLIHVAAVAAVAAVAVPAASAATPQYDGYKSGYPQLRQILTYHAASGASRGCTSDRPPQPRLRLA